jgi:uncharacterized protein YqjF (DUF2071 family)
MLNYEVAPALLAPYVPAGCQLDAWNGRTFLSVVGFQFLFTRVAGLAIPFHRHFEEVNLRLYVKRQCDGEWRRGVVFVKEIVPRAAIAWVARAVYGENYVALPMRHAVTPAEQSPAAVAYEWRRAGNWERLSATASGAAVIPSVDSEESFIAEHYWGYARQRDGSTVEYEVEHPPWRVWRAARASLACDGRTLYGPAFAEALSGEMSSAFIADGSAVVVRRGRRL